MNLDEFGWALGQGEHDGMPMFIRLRKFPDSFEKDRYPERIDICWTIAEPNEHGLPSSEEMDRMREFEDALVNAVEHDEHSVLSFSILCNGERRLMFYTADVAGFVGRLESMPHPHGKYPISLERTDDPDWEYYNEFAGPDSEGNELD